MKKWHNIDFNANAFHHSSHEEPKQVAYEHL